jgi:hypothetical protein
MNFLGALSSQQTTKRFVSMSAKAAAHMLNRTAEVNHFLAMADQARESLTNKIRKVFARPHWKLPLLGYPGKHPLQLKGPSRTGTDKIRTTMRESEAVQILFAAANRICSFAGSRGDSTAKGQGSGIVSSTFPNRQLLSRLQTYCSPIIPGDKAWKNMRSVSLLPNK